MINVSRRKLARYAADQLVAGVSAKDLSRRLAAALISSKRTHQADLLASDIAWELESRGIVASAVVTSANSLTDSLRRQITQYVKKAAEVETAVVETQIDKSVIGGVRIETARHAWDKTLAHQLNSLREEF